MTRRQALAMVAALVLAYGAGVAVGYGWPGLAGAVVGMTVAGWLSGTALARHPKPESAASSPASAMADLADIYRTCQELADGQRAQMEAAGWSPTVAETVAANTLMSLVHRLNSP